MEAVREIDKGVKLGLKGVSVDPSLHKLHSKDRKMYPIYAKCVEYGVPIVVHTGATTWGNKWTYLEYSDIMDLDVVATDFPELVVIASHAGFPWVWPMLNVCLRHPNVYIETSGIDSAYKALGAADPYYAAANGWLQNQFVYGSAKPYISLKFSIEGFLKEPYSDETKRKILWDNASRILKI